jgi:adenylate kinase family enzyme
MERVVVLGIPGSGKSTISRFIGNHFGIPVLHLDTVFWLPNWQKASPESFNQAHAEWMNKPAWVIDGNYRRTLDERLALADTVVLLAFPTLAGFWYAFVRSIKERGKSRPDMTIGCIEKFDWEFAKWILRFNRDVLPVLESTVSSHPHIHVVRLQNRRQMKRWMALLSNS